MSWHIARIDREPDKCLDTWMVFEVPFDGADRPWTRHLVGLRIEAGKGQVSSPVEKFDPIHRRAMTRTGQVYGLGACMGANPDAMSLWAKWKHLNGIAHERDVTGDVADDMGHVYPQL